MFYYFIGKFSIYLMKKEQKVIFAKFQNGQNMPSNRTWWSKILVKKKKGRFVELRQRSERFATHIIALTTEYLEEWMIIIYIDDKCFFFGLFFSPWEQTTHPLVTSCWTPLQSQVHCLRVFLVPIHTVCLLYMHLNTSRSVHWRYFTDICTSLCT